MSTGSCQAWHFPIFQGFSTELQTLWQVVNGSIWEALLVLLQTLLHRPWTGKIPIPRIISSFYCPVVRQFSVDAVFPHVVWLYLSKQAFDSGRVSSPEPSSPSSSRELIAKQSGEILGTELWGASKALVRPAKSISLFLWHILKNIGNKTRYSPWLQLGMNIISCCKRKDNRYHESGDQEYLFLSQVSLYSRGLDVGWPNCWGQSLGKSWRGAKKTMVVWTMGLNTLDTKIVDFALSVGGGKLKQVIYIYIHIWMFKTTKPLKGSWT